jgi:hypothetical protein
MPLDSHEVISSKIIATAKVIQVTGFRSILQLHDNCRLPEEGALAYLSHEALYRWPIALTDDLHFYTDIFENSRFIRPSDGQEPTKEIARICKEGETICLYDGVAEKYSRKIASLRFHDSQSMEDVLREARTQTEALARGYHLLALKAKPDELLSHDLRITFNVDKKSQELPLDGSGSVQVGDHVIITLLNNGDSVIYVSVFDINAAGKITHLSRSWPRGIRIQPHERYELGVNSYSNKRRGMKISWPKGFPADVEEPIPESFICMITNEPVDLRDFSRERRGERRSDPSQLEKLAYQLTYGQGRDCAGEDEDLSIQWDRVRVPFLLYNEATQFSSAR